MRGLAAMRAIRRLCATPTCPADINGDNVVDVLDLLDVLATQDAIADTAQDIAGLLVEHIQAADIASLLDLARPERPVYGKLKEALGGYRRIRAEGGWPVVPEGKAIKPGDTDPRIRSLRERLSATGDYRSGGSRVSSEYDSALVEAVKRFQTRHGLEADGIVGSDTLAEMNVSVDRRINQIRVNLERLRWYMHELQGEYLLTDIAAFEVYWIRDGKIVWQKPVQVGKDYTETPVFKDEVEYHHPPTTDLDEDGQVDFKGKAKAFVRALDVVRSTPADELAEAHPEVREALFEAARRRVAPRAQPRGACPGHALASIAIAGRARSSAVRAGDS